MIYVYIHHIFCFIKANIFGLYHHFFYLFIIISFFACDAFIFCNTVCMKIITLPCVSLCLNNQKFRAFIRVSFVLSPECVSQVSF